ncbi:MAG: 1-hydroxycarotenoid 3,4-desaturase CrtD [Polyangiaceae bacterium]|jgi:1-hydroxycarotenoid 3,4-desaturase
MHSLGVGAQVVVIGAGVGGLCAAIDLAVAGCSVTVLERGEQVGGKLAFVDIEGTSVDLGPTVLTMRWVFVSLFASASREIGDYVSLQKADVLSRHAWPDGVKLDLFSDEERSAAAIEAAFGASEAEAYRRFVAHCKTIYDAVDASFLRAQRPDWQQAMREIKAVGLRGLLRIDAHRTMARTLEQTFRTPHLRQLFGRYATYCGSSPLEAPSTLNLIAHVEGRGVDRVRGGMRALAGALARLAGDVGVEIRLGAHVDRILVRDGVARGVALHSGPTQHADAVVFNGDVSALGASLLGSDAAKAVRAVAPRTRSLSAITWAMVARAEGFPLLHHNVFFSADGPAEYRSLMDPVRHWRDDPTVYVCAQERGDVAQGSAEEPLLIVVNAPPTGANPSMWNREVILRWERAAFSTLERSGLKLFARATRTTTPLDFEKRFPATGGALYGQRVSGPLSPLTRPGARSGLAGLYLAGGSAHPGPGLPMAALSGRLAANRVLEDLPSTRRSPQAATSGTTSMP